mmetsp:Transcript_2358/g.4516  ORF Transcript_2358/g.4516 Transcript_2358/m.4516 type:complete len:426 (-) Transcript_2358:163-1440(-)
MGDARIGRQQLSELLHIREGWVSRSFLDHHAEDGKLVGVVSIHMDEVKLHGKEASLERVFRERVDVELEEVEGAPGDGRGSAVGVREEEALARVGNGQRVRRSIAELNGGSHAINDVTRHDINRRLLHACLAKPSPVARANGSGVIVERGSLSRNFIESDVAHHSGGGRGRGRGRAGWGRRGNALGRLPEEDRTAVDRLNWSVSSAEGAGELELLESRNQHADLLGRHGNRAGHHVPRNVFGARGNRKRTHVVVVVPGCWKEPTEIERGVERVQKAVDIREQLAQTVGSEESGVFVCAFDNHHTDDRKSAVGVSVDKVHLRRESSAVEGVLRRGVEVDVDEVEDSAVDTHRVSRKPVELQGLTVVDNGDWSRRVAEDDVRGVARDYIILVDVDRRLLLAILAYQPIGVQRMPDVRTGRAFVGKQR